ncbi:TonB-dependent siderophore receptor [Corticibacter populi]|uniref:TonB-dependent siderophore receptor n=1 Tax=Corticibacter populi TaxID=1550736 RepID=UPI001F5FF0BC|nr:TonB-dependent receptor [Corticibacter populi]
MPIPAHLPRALSAVPLRMRAGMLATSAILALSAHAQSGVSAISIPPQPLGQAINALALQTGARIIYSTELTEQKTAPAVAGTLTVRQALDQLLAGSGLVADVQGAEVVVRKAAAPARPEASAALPEVAVTAAGYASAETYGTGSYTSGSTNTATGLALSIRETPQSVSVITSQRMQDQGLTQLTDVAAQTAGLTVSQGGNVGSDSSPIYSRGFQVDNYMVDGVKLLNSYSSIFQSQDMALYDRVEIVRGASGLMNGAGKPGATINLVRKRPLRDFAASANVELGSWRYRRLDADISAPLNQSGSVRGRLVAAVQDADSYIDRLEEDRKVLYGVIETDLGPATVLRAGASKQRHDSTGHARGGLPAYYSDGSRTHWSRSDSAAPSWAYSRRHSTSAFAELEHVFSNDWQIKASLSRTKTDSDELVGYASGGNPDRATGAGVSIWATHWVYTPRQDVLDVSANGQFSLLGRQHDLALGATLARSEHSDPAYTNWSHAGWSGAVPDIFDWDGTYPAEPYNPSVGYGGAKDRSNGIFASLRLRPSDAFSVILGTRVADWRRETSSHRYATGLTTVTKRQETGEVIPFAGLVYDFSPHWSAYASYTTIFEPQSLKTATGDYLDPLMGNTYEAGIKGAFYDDRLNIGAAIYQTREDNKGIAITDVYAPDGSQAYESVAGAKSRGIELEVAGLLRPGWEMSASFSRNITTDRDGERLNTNVPQNTAKLFTSYRLQGIGNGLTIGGGLRWQNAIYTDGLGPNRDQRFVQPSYAVVDLMARYSVSKNVVASINISNLFDKHYYTSTGNSYYGAPRGVRAGLNVQF